MKDENMNKAYVEWREKGYWIANSWVSLDTIVYGWQVREKAKSA